MNKLFYVCSFIMLFSYCEQLFSILTRVDVLKDLQGRIIYLYSDRHIKMYNENVQQFKTMMHIVKNMQTRFHFLIEAPSAAYDDIDDSPPTVMTHILSFIHKNQIPTVTAENIELRDMSGMAHDILYPEHDLEYYSKERLIEFKTGTKCLKDLTLADVFNEFNHLVKDLSSVECTQEIISSFIQQKLKEADEALAIAKILIEAFNNEYQEESISYQDSILDIASRLHKKPLVKVRYVDNCRNGLWMFLFKAFSPFIDGYIAQKAASYKGDTSLIIIAGGDHIKEVREKVLLKLGYTSLYSKYSLENSLTFFLKEEELALLNEALKIKTLGSTLN